MAWIYFFFSRRTAIFYFSEDSFSRIICVFIDIFTFYDSKLTTDCAEDTGFNFIFYYLRHKTNVHVELDRGHVPFRIVPAARPATEFSQTFYVRVDLDAGIKWDFRPFSGSLAQLEFKYWGCYSYESLVKNLPPSQNLT